MCHKMFYSLSQTFYEKLINYYKYRFKTRMQCREELNENNFGK